MTVRHVFFDFFGTLVHYRDGVAGNPVARSLAFLGARGIALDAAALTARWQSVWDDIDREASASLREVHMHESARRLFSELGVEVDEETVAGFVARYIDDWNEGVAPVDGLHGTLARIDAPASIVSNTYYPPLVPAHVERLGLTARFERIVTSIDHGWRKPHDSIYRAALDAAGVAAADALFVGDNPLCDYHGPRRLGMRAVLIATRPQAGVREDDRIGRLADLRAWIDRAEASKARPA